MGDDARGARAATRRVALGVVFGAAFLACAGEIARSVASGSEDAGAEAGAEAAPGPAPRVDADAAPAWHPLVGELDPTFPIVTVGKGACGCCRGAALAVAADDSIRVLSRGGGTDALPVIDCVVSLSPSGEVLTPEATVGKRLDSTEPLTRPVGLANGRTAIGPLLPLGTVVILDAAAHPVGAWMVDAGELGTGYPMPTPFGRLLREDGGTVVLVGSVHGPTDGGSRSVGGHLARAADDVVQALAPIPGGEIPAAAELDATGRILVGTRAADGGMRLLAVRSDFTADPSFGDAGAVDLAWRGALVPLPDGRFDVIAREAGVARFGPQGAPDPSFGSGGVVDVPLPESFAAAAERDGHLVLSRVFYPGPNLVVSRLTPDGREDLTFGEGGRVVLPDLSPWNADSPKLAFQSDGKLLVLWKPFLFRIR